MLWHVLAAGEQPEAPAARGSGGSGCERQRAPAPGAAASGGAWGCGPGHPQASLGLRIAR